MERYYDKDGNDITEVVQKKIETESAAKIKVAEDAAAAMKLENDKLKEKDTNFENLKKSSEEAIANVKKEFDDFKTATNTDKKNEIMRLYTNGNKEVTKKIEDELTALGLPLDTAENIETAIRKAAAIVAPEMNTIISAGSRMGGKGTGAGDGTNAEVETAEQRNVRLKFGISDEQAIKYGEPGVIPLVAEKK